MNDAIAEGSKGLLEWSEPVIVDRLVTIYGQHVSRHAEARALAMSHAKVWRALISGDYESFAARRDDLVAALAVQDLTLNDFASADSEILVELLEIVVARFQRSQRTAMGYHLALIELSRHMMLPTAA
jgi:hypothetical protein